MVELAPRLIPLGIQELVRAKHPKESSEKERGKLGRLVATQETTKIIRWKRETLKD